LVRGYAEGVNAKIRLTPLLFATAVLTAFGPSASAHTELIKSNPASNSMITQHPASITLTFSEAPILVGSRISIEQPTGAPISSETAKLVGTALVIPWPAQIQPGTVTVNWRAVADDGHVTNGAFDFSYQSATGNPTHSPRASIKSVRKIVPWSFGIIVVVLLAGIVATTRRKK